MLDIDADLRARSSSPGHHGDPAPRARPPRRHGPGLPARRRRHAARHRAGGSRRASCRHGPRPPGGRLRRPDTRQRRPLPAGSRLRHGRGRADDLVSTIPTESWPTLGDSISTSSARAVIAGCGRCSAPTPVSRRHGRRVLRGVGAQRPGRAGGRRLELLGRPGAPDALARLARASGSCSSPVSGPAPATSTSWSPPRAARPQGGPHGLRHRSAARTPPAWSRRSGAPLGRRWMASARRTDDLRGARDDGLRSPPGLVASHQRRRRRAPAPDLPASWPSSCPSTWSSWASPTWR